jgi:anti-sigma regulatory factor (Ser/Thr protein kinase)
MTLPIKITIPSEPKYLCLVRRVLMDFLASQRVSEGTSSKVALCVDEACSNVIKYGYEGKADCPIEISFLFEKGNFNVKIRDYGKTCDARKIKPRPLDEVKPGGLGTHFINQIMDSVEYCCNFERGTLLIMSKKLEIELNVIPQKGESDEC